MSYNNGNAILTSNWLSARHAAYHFDVPFSLLQEWLQDGELSQWRLGDQLVVAVDEVAQLLKDWGVPV